MRSALPVVFAAAALISVLPTSAFAQDGFFFKAPVVSLEVRVGRTGPAVGGGIFDDLTSNLTLERKDFAATTFAADASFRASGRMDVVIGTGYAKSSALSESREYVDQDDQPIVQTTRLSKLPVSAGARFYPLSRGEAIGQYAWIPRPFTPYVGAGAGLMHYRLEQQGDFVNYQDLSIFNDRLESTGNTVMAYGEGGASYWLNHRVGLSAGARYTFATADMRRDYEGFDNIDLSGFQASAGLAVRF